jgi:hypothetical protein
MSKKMHSKLALLGLAALPVLPMIWNPRPAWADQWVYSTPTGTGWYGVLYWTDTSDPLGSEADEPPDDLNEIAFLGQNSPRSNVTVNFQGSYSQGLYQLNVDSGFTLNQSSAGYNMISKFEFLGFSGNGTYDQSAALNQVADNLTLGASTTGVGTGEGFYNLSGTGTLTLTGSASAWVGYTDNGTFDQEGGTATIGGDLNVGDFVGVSGEYLLNWNSPGDTGSLTVTGTEYVGEFGSGTMKQAGGTNHAAALIIAWESGSTGDYELDRGTLNVPDITINAGGTFNQNGGTLSFSSLSQTGGSSSLLVGLNVGNGTVSLSGGTMAVSGVISLSSGGVFHQSGGVLTFTEFNQTGGTANFDTGLTGDVTYSLSGGSLTTSSIATGSPSLSWTGGTLTMTAQPFDVAGTLNDTIYHGFNYGSSLTLNSGMTLNANFNFELLLGSGTSITQNAGSTNNTPSIYMGATGTNAVGVQYNLNGGSLTTGLIAIGANGGYAGPNNGTFTQTGGTATTTTLDVDYNAPGTYSLSAGTMSVTGVINLVTGGVLTQSGGTLTFPVLNETGGTANFNTGLNLSTSTVNLSGGSLTTTTITAGGIPNVHFTGGSLTITGQPVDFGTPGTDGAHHAIVFGNSLTLNSGMSLSVTNSSAWEWLFGNGSSITQNTGSSNSTPTLYMGTTGANATTDTYNLAGGSLTVTGNADIGFYIAYPTTGTGAASFNQTGGTASFNALNIGFNASGTYGLLAGSVTASTTTNEGSFTQTGGTANLGVLSGLGTVALDSGGGNAASLTVTQFTQGSIIIGSSGKFIVQPNSNFANSVTTLTITGTGQLDLKNNHMFINYGAGPDPISSVAALLVSGYNHGAWTGPGINSSTAAANSSSYALGYADSADPGNPAGLSSGTIEIKYTLLGDADLNGTVNGIDFGILAANFNKTVSRWDQGDFDYNNIVNGLDFTALASNFNKAASGAAVGAGALSDPALVAFAQANGLMADVPEPACAGLLLISATAALLPRRSRARASSTHTTEPDK